jgi:trehalose-phosphatase
MSLVSHSHALGSIPAQLWDRARAARHRLLLLDYDGTIAPLRPDRDASLPPPVTMEWLARVASARAGTLAVISGRPLEELERFLGTLAIGLWAEHGWGWRDAAGARHSVPLDSRVAGRLASAARRTAAWADASCLERKRTALVLHTRGLPEATASNWRARCEREWEEFATGGALRLDRVSGGVELSAWARHMGTVVEELRERSPAGTFGVYVGDDTTDEDAFEALAGWGEGVRVGAAGTPTRASGRLPGSESLPEFLAAWLRETDSGEVPHTLR